jgi:hypothetical protein
MLNFEFILVTNNILKTKMSNVYVRTSGTSYQEHYLDKKIIKNLGQILIFLAIFWTFQAKAQISALKILKVLKSCATKIDPNK